MIGIRLLKSIIKFFVKLGGKSNMGLNKEEMIIARIANPYVSYSKEKLKNISLNFVYSNKISLLLSEKGIETNTSREDKEKVECLMDELCNLTQVFDAHGVNYVIIKLPKLPKSLSDIDILILDDSIEAAVVALKQMGYILEDDVEPHRRTYVKTVNGERIAVDLHLELSWRRVIYLEKEEIWKNRIKREINGVNIPVPSPEHELLISAAHAVFKHNKITLFDVLYVNSIITENDINMDFVEETARRNGWQKQFLFFIRSINEIYKELYDDPKSSLNPKNQTNIKCLPFLFPLHSIISLRARKMLSDLRYFGAKRAFIDLYAYSLDVVQYIFEEKLDISLSPFFNMLSFLKRRVGRWN